MRAAPLVSAAEHGGWAASILDSAMALATLSWLDEHHLFTTLEIKINYVRGMTEETGEVRAEGRVVNGGRRVVLSEAKLVDREGRLFATGQSTCLVIPRQKQQPSPPSSGRLSGA